MVSAILFAVLLLILCGAYFKMRRPGAALFNAVWAVVFLICCREFSMEEYGLTQFLLCLMVILVNAGYGWSNSRPAETVKPKSGHYLRQDSDELNEKLLMTILAVASAIIVWYAIQTVRVFGFDLVEIRGHNNTSNDAGVFGSQVDTVLFYGIATPLIYTVILIFAYSFSQGIRIKKRFYAITLAAVLLQMVTTGGGRGIILRSVLFFVAAFIIRFPLGRELGIEKKKIGMFLGIGVVLVVILEVITFIRNEGEVSFVGQAFDYIRGSVGHMQYRLTRPMEHQYYGGLLTFGGFFYYPIKVLNLLFGTQIESSSEILVYLQEYRQVTLYDQTVNYNAMVPNAFYFFRDNGYVGVVALSFLHGYLLEKAERKIKKPTFIRFVMWATCVYMIAYSPIDGVLWTFRHPTTIIYCVLLSKFLYKPVKKDQRRKHGSIDHGNRSNL